MMPLLAPTVPARKPSFEVQVLPRRQQKKRRHWRRLGMVQLEPTLWRAWEALQSLARVRVAPMVKMSMRAWVVVFLPNPSYPAMLLEVDYPR